MAEALESRQLLSVNNLLAEDDAFVRNGSNAETEYGVTTPNALEVKTDAVSGYTRYAYLSFDVSSLGSIINSATLKLYGNLSSAGSEPISAHALTNPAATWDETTINWNNAPAINSTIVDTVNVTTTSDALYEVDVESLVQDAKTNNRSTVTIALRRDGGNSSAGVYFNSAEYSDSDLRPKLVVDHDTPSPPPPSGGTVDVRAAEDTYVRDGSHAGNSYGTDGLIQVKWAGAVGSNRKGLLKFSTSSFSSVQSATLTLWGYVSNASQGNVTVAGSSISNHNWTESITWSQANTAGLLTGGTYADSNVVSGTTQVQYVFDVTNVVAAAKANGDPFVSFRLDGEGVTEGFALFISDENTTFSSKYPVMSVTQQAAPAAPTNLAATAASPTAVDLTWDDNASIETGFRIEKSTDGGSTWSFAANASANAESVQITGLTENTAYQFRIRAENAAGNSAWSGAASATTPLSVPAAPTNLAATALTPWRVGLTWNDNSLNEHGFLIERADGAGGWAVVDVVAANVTAYTEDALADNSSYTYRVRAYNAAGNSSESTGNVTTALGFPENVIALVGTGTQVYVTWDDSSAGETLFRVQRAPSGGTYSEVGVVSAGNAMLLDESADAGVTYHYRVRAETASAVSDWSFAAEVTTNPPAPLAPGSLSAVANPSSPFTQINLSWNDVAGETGYRISRSTSGGPYEVLADLDPDLTSYSDHGLIHGRSYAYQVLAYNDGGESPSSEIASATRLPAPEESSGSMIAGGYAAVTWQDGIDGEDGFELEASLNGGAFGNTVVLDPNSTTYHFGSLQGGGTYVFRVRAFKGEGAARIYSEWATTSSAVASDPSPLVFQNSFALDASGFDGAAINTTVESPADGYLGDFTSTGTMLSVSGLPDHATLKVRFKLLVLNSWDGDSGGDTFTVGVLGEHARTLLDATFSNTSATQSYPDSGSPARTGAGREYVHLDNDTDGCSCGCASPLADSEYEFEYVFPHDGETLNVQFSATGMDGQEAWGLDDVEVEIVQPEVSVEAVASAVMEGGIGQFRFSRTGDATASLTVPYSIGGSGAAQGSAEDIERADLSGTVTFPAGVSSVVSSFNVNTDDLFEGVEEVSVRLLGAVGHVLEAPVAVINLQDANLQVKVVKKVTVGVFSDIEFTILDAAGDPINYHDVSVVDWDENLLQWQFANARNGTTDENSSVTFKIRGRVAGKTAEPLKFQLEDGRTGTVDLVSGHQEVRVAPNNLQLTLYQGQERQVPVRVFDANNEPLAGQQLTFVADDPEVVHDMGTTHATDGAGATFIRLHGLAPEILTIGALASASDPDAGVLLDILVDHVILSVRPQDPPVLTTYPSDEHRNKIRVTAKNARGNAISDVLILQDFENERIRLAPPEMQDGARTNVVGRGWIWVEGTPDVLGGDCDVYIYSGHPSNSVTVEMSVTSVI